LSGCYEDEKKLFLCQTDRPIILACVNTLQSLLFWHLKLTLLFALMLPMKEFLSTYFGSGVGVISIATKLYAGQL
jgi:hypothetical protein